MNKCDISVVVPVYNEVGNLALLSQKIKEALLELGRGFEIIFVNDGSTDGSSRLLEEIRDSQQNIIIIDLFRSNGKAAALEQGFKIIKGEYVVIIDSDLQYDPGDIPALIHEMEKGADVVSAKRIQRSDSGSTIRFSGIFNKLLRFICRLPIEDYFSGLKCFRKDVLDYVSLDGNLIRFISVFAYHEGFKVVEVPLKHYERIHGSSRNSFGGRILLALLDLLVVLTMFTLNKHRMYFFGLGGYLLLGLGTILLFICFMLVEPGKAAFNNPIGIIGIVMSFISIQILILKKLWDEYFTRYQEGYSKRMRNVKSISKS